MKHIKDLEAQMNATKEELKKQWYAIFSNSGQIRRAVENLENSSEYQFNECGDIEKWYCPNFDLPENGVEFLKEYLGDEYCIYYIEPRNGQNDLMTQTCEFNGEYYLLSDEGDIFYNNNLFIENGTVKNKEEAFELIEKNMNKEGVFPGVYQSDRYSNLEVLKGYYKWLKTKGESNA